MKNIYPELALYGGKIECARTDKAFFPISEVCDGTVSFLQYGILYFCFTITCISVNLQVVFL